MGKPLWTPSVDFMLHDDDLRAALVRFSEEHHKDPEVKFMISVNELQNTAKEDIDKKCRAIFDEFVAKNSPKEINVRHSVRKVTIKKYRSHFDSNGDDEKMQSLSTEEKKALFHHCVYRGNCDIQVNNELILKHDFYESGLFINAVYEWDKEARAYKMKEKYEEPSRDPSTHNEDVIDDGYGSDSPSPVAKNGKSGKAEKSGKTKWYLKKAPFKSNKTKTTSVESQKQGLSYQERIQKEIDNEMFAKARDSLCLWNRAIAASTKENGQSFASIRKVHESKSRPKQDSKEQKAITQIK